MVDRQGNDNVDADVAERKQSYGIETRQEAKGGGVVTGDGDRWYGERFNQ